MRPDKKRQLKIRRRWRVRAKVQGTKERPRLSVTFTGKHIYAQVIDDEAGRTLAASSTRDKANADAGQLGANIESAKVIGGRAAKAALDAGVSAVVFDRGGAAYHGKVKALADAAREGGLKF